MHVVYEKSRFSMWFWHRSLLDCRISSTVPTTSTVNYYIVYVVTFKYPSSHCMQWCKWRIQRRIQRISYIRGSNFGMQRMSGSWRRDGSSPRGPRTEPMHGEG